MTSAAINRSLQKLPFVIMADPSVGVTEGDGHYAPNIIMKRGGEYTFDWWMTLEIDNPILWRTKDWRLYAMTLISNKYVPFRDFEGFDN